MRAEDVPTGKAEGTTLGMLATTLGTLLQLGLRRDGPAGKERVVLSLLEFVCCQQEGYPAARLWASA